MRELDPLRERGEETPPNKKKGREDPSPSVFNSDVLQNSAGVRPVGLF
jgi:hypothetical protein